MLGLGQKWLYSYSDISATNCRRSQPYLPSRSSLRLAKSPILGNYLVPTWEYVVPLMGIIARLNGNKKVAVIGIITATCGETIVSY